METIIIGSDGVTNYSFVNATRNITITGLSFTLEPKHIAYIYNMTQEVLIYAPVSPKVGTRTVSVSGGVITYDSSIDALATGDLLHIQIYPPNYGRTEEGYNMVYVLNPEYNHNTSPEHLISLTNQAAGTTRYVIPMEDYKNMAIHWDLVGSATDTVTMTLWGTLKEDADDSADDDWLDLSTEILGAANKASSSATPEEDMAFIDTSFPILKFMVKIVVTSGTTNTVDVYIKKA